MSSAATTASSHPQHQGQDQGQGDLLPAQRREDVPVDGNVLPRGHECIARERAVEVGGHLARPVRVS